MGKWVWGSSELCLPCFITDHAPCFLLCFSILTFASLDYGQALSNHRDVALRVLSAWNALSPAFPMAGSVMSLGISQMGPPQKSLL